MISIGLAGGERFRQWMADTPLVDDGAGAGEEEVVRRVGRHQGIPGVPDQLRWFGLRSDEEHGTQPELPRRLKTFREERSRVVDRCRTQE